MATSDEQFHEFHLGGKQLIFLFMASLVVAVVIFLWGVMVGRDVRAPRVGEPTEASAATIFNPTAPSDPRGSSAETLRENGGTPPAEDLTYTARLESPSPSPETLREQPETPRKQPEILREPAPPESPAPASPRAGTTAESRAGAAPLPGTVSLREPAGTGFVVQVMSVTQLVEAETVARRLVSKGYPAFVSPTSEGGQRFRVRVGKYADRREALSVASRLEKEEKFKKPWVPR